MKIIAFAASNHRQSINQMLVRYASSLAQEISSSELEVEVLDLNDYEMPIFSEDREEDEGIPELAHRFYEKLGTADYLAISFAEHNGAYTAAYKNLFDWTSRIDVKVYQGKPGVVLATSPGGRGASSVLEIATSSIPRFGMELKGSLSVPSFYENFDTEEGKLTNSDLNTELNQLMKTLIESD